MHDDYELKPDHPMPHQMVERSSSDSIRELPVIFEEKFNSKTLYQSDMSIGMLHGEVHTSTSRYIDVLLCILQIVVMVMESRGHKQIFLLMVLYEHQYSHAT